MRRRRFTDEQIAFALRQAENGKLQRLVANLGLHKEILQDVLRKKVVRRARRREVVRHFEVAYAVSERRACLASGFGRASHRYVSRRDPQEPLRGRLKELATAGVRYGCRRLHVLLRCESWEANHKRVYRPHGEEGPSIRTRTVGIEAPWVRAR